jgi:glutaredoxin 2
VEIGVLSLLRNIFFALGTNFPQRVSSVLKKRVEPERMLSFFNEA